MKNRLFKSLTVICSLLLVTLSCSKDDSYGDQLVIGEGYGDIITYENYTYTVLDSDDDLIIITNGEAFDFEVGDRVSFACEVISVEEDEETDVETFTVRAISMDEIKVKDVVLKSEIKATDDGAEGTVTEESLGNDFIEIRFAECGEKYLDINFIIPYFDSEIIHHLNLVIDDSTPFTVVDGVLEIDAEFRHNAFDDKMHYTGYGLMSFNIEKYTSMADVKEIRFNISYQRGENSIITLKVEEDFEK